MVLHAFIFIRTSKFCRGSLFLIFWLLQPLFFLNRFLFLWAVWNGEKSKQKDKALKNNVDRLCFEEISAHYLRLLLTVHFVLSRSPRPQAAEINFFVDQCTRFSKVSTRNIFTFFQSQPELVLKLFLLSCSVLFRKSEHWHYSTYWEQPKQGELRLDFWVTTYG